MIALQPDCFINKFIDKVRMVAQCKVQGIRVEWGTYSNGEALALPPALDGHPQVVVGVVELFVGIAVREDNKES